MSKPIRCFLAVRVSAHQPLVQLIRELGSLGRTIRDVDPQGLHITLKFLGETRPEDIGPICEGLRSHLAGVTPVEGTVRGLGVFPSPRRPRVVWAGVEPAEPLQELARRCESVCQPLGYPGESRGFQPHVTLARIEGRPPEQLAAILAEHSETQFGPLPIHAIELMQSELSGGGPKYTTSATVPLGRRERTADDADDTGSHGLYEPRS